MFIKRGLVLLVFLLVIPLVNPNGQSSQSFQCADGTLVGNCNRDNLFCSPGNNLIVNGGFETDSDGNGIPNFFLKDTNAVLNQNVFYSDDAYSGEKSIKLTKQWYSFDYFYPYRVMSIPLQLNKEYLFLSFVKGTCNDIRVYYSNSQTGTAEGRLCGGSSNPCALSPVENNWNRLIVQFNSNEITTRTSEALGNFPYMNYLRIECADSAPFELYVDNMFLSPVNPSPILIESCDFCDCSRREREAAAEAAAKVLTLPDTLVEAIETENCDLIDNDNNIRDYCYEQIRECDEISDRDRRTRCNSRHEYLETAGKITYRAYWLYSTEYNRYFYPNVGSYNYPAISAAIEASRELSPDGYDKIGRKEPINNYDDYWSRQLNIPQSYFILFEFDVPIPAEEIMVNVAANGDQSATMRDLATDVKAYRDGILESTATISTRGSALRSTNECQSPFRWIGWVEGCDYFQQDNVNIPVAVIDGKAILLIRDRINSINVVGVN